jgi:hypothetical protein
MCEEGHTGMARREPSQNGGPEKDAAFERGGCDTSVRGTATNSQEGAQMTGGPWLDRGRGLWAATPMCGLGAHRHELKKLLPNQDVTVPFMASLLDGMVTTPMCERKWGTQA